MASLGSFCWSDVGVKTVSCQRFWIELDKIYNTWLIICFPLSQDVSVSSLFIFIFFFKKCRFSFLNIENRLVCSGWEFCFSKHWCRRQKMSLEMQFHQAKQNPIRTLTDAWTTLETHSSIHGTPPVSSCFIVPWSTTLYNDLHVFPWFPTALKS